MLTKSIHLPTDNMRSILGWFQADMRGSEEQERIIEALEILSQRAKDFGHDRYLSPGEKIQYERFARWAEENILSSDRLMDAIMEKWGDLPLVLKIGGRLRTERMVEMAGDIYINLPKEERQKISAITDRIMGLREYRYIIASYGDSGRNGETIEELDIPKNMQKQALEDTGIYVRTIITLMVEEGGALIFKRSMERNGPAVISGYVAVDGCLYPADTDTLKECCGDDGRDTYEEDDIISEEEPNG